VHAATHRATGLPVAIKSLFTAPSPDRLVAFQREAALVARLDHPNVVPVLDTGVVPESTSAPTGLTPGSPYLVMARASDTLVDHLGAWSWAPVREVLVGLLDALGHAHARGVLHCDVKPSNVLLGVRRDERQPLGAPWRDAALADFGIARRIGRAGPRGGTPGYMAPEQVADDEASLGPWTDLYGLGAVAWALMAGGPPVGEGPLVAHHPLPTALEAWLRWLLAPAPGDRPARACEALAALPSAEGSEVSIAPGPSHADEPTQAVREPVADASGPDGAEVSTLRRGPPVGESREIPTPRRVEVPESWRRRRAAWPSPALQDAGLGLWGLREPVLVGRDDACDALWSALRTAATTGCPQVRYVVGPPGVGRSRLLRWSAEHAHARAGAHTLRLGPTEPLPPPPSALTVLTIDDRDDAELARQIAQLAALSAVPAGPWLVVVGLSTPHGWSIPPGLVIELGPLSPADAEELARHALPLTPELALRLARESAGRPGPLLDQVGRWIAADALVATPRGYALPAEPAGTPAGGPSELELAAVCGAWVPDGLLPDAVVLRAERAGLVVRDDSGWRFQHGDLRRSLVAQAADRAGHHEACARWWAARPARTAAEARHWSEAGAPERGLRIALDAGRTAVRRGGLREAAEAVAAARSAADRANVPGRARARAEIAALRLQLDASHLGTEERASLADWLSRVAAAAGWWDLLAEALARQAVDRSNRGLPDQGKPLAERAVALADTHGIERTRVLGRLYLGHIALLLGDLDAARGCFDALDALAADHPDPSWARCAAGLGHSLLARRTGDAHTALQRASEALDEATAAGLDLDRAKALRALGAAARMVGDLDLAEATWRRYLATAREVGLTADLPNACADLGEALRQRGELREAERMLLQALAWMRQAHQADAIPRLNLARLYVDEARLDEAWGLLGPDALEIGAVHWPSLVPQVLALRIAIAAGRGDAASVQVTLAALEELDRASFEVDPETRELVQLAARACVEAGWLDVADRTARLTT